MRLARIPVYLASMCLAASLRSTPAWAGDSALPAVDRIGQAEVSAQLRSQANGQLASFYGSRGFSPIWAMNGNIGPEADALIGFLATANLDGLDPGSYNLAGLREAIQAARAQDARAVAHAELELSLAFTRYVHDMRSGPGDGMIYLDARLSPEAARTDAVLRAASLQEPFKHYVSSMGWMSPQYVQLRGLLAAAVKGGSPDNVVRRLRVNLERARALPGPWTRHIVVDTASGMLWYYQDGRQVGAMRVVVGKPRAQTPMLAGMLNYAILNPYWNVPVDLAQSRIAPKVIAGRSLQSMRMEVLSDWSETARQLDPATIDWKAVASGSQKIRLRQLPGGNNSMGRIKFSFPNDRGIYLHDTPERQLFARPDRHLSNGCIRLENATRLGEWLIGRPIVIDPQAPEQPVALPEPVPVYLTYITAINTARGVDFLQDVYERDRETGNRLADF